MASDEIFFDSSIDSVPSRLRQLQSVCLRRRLVLVGFRRTQTVSLGLLANHLWQRGQPRTEPPKANTQEDRGSRVRATTAYKRRKIPAIVSCTSTSRRLGLRRCRAGREGSGKGVTQRRKHRRPKAGSVSAAAPSLLGSPLVPKPLDLLAWAEMKVVFLAVRLEPSRSLGQFSRGRSLGHQ